MLHASKTKPCWLSYFMYIVHHTCNVQVHVICRECIGSLHTKVLTIIERQNNSFQATPRKASNVQCHILYNILEEMNMAILQRAWCCRREHNNLLHLLHDENIWHLEAYKERYKLWSQQDICNNAEHLMQLICKNSHRTQVFEERRLARVLITLCTPSLILARRPLVAEVELSECSW